jgi:hypothetical protein
LFAEIGQLLLQPNGRCNQESENGIHVRKQFLTQPRSSSQPGSFIEKAILVFRRIK